MNECGCSTYIPWLDKSDAEKAKERAVAAELERRAERRVTQGRLAMYLSNSTLRDEVFRVCGVSTDVELMSLIVDEIGCEDV